MPKLSQDNSASQREVAYQGLRRLLILQQVEPGKRLREPEWAGRLGVHRSALREAFARLEAEGLIERGPQTGYFVPRLSAEDLQEINKLRLALECLAIDEICGGKGRAPLSEMERARDDFGRFVQGGYSLGAIEADRRFHEALIAAAGLRRLSDLYRRAPLPMIHRDVHDPVAWEQEGRRTHDEHRRLLQHLHAGEAKAAKAVLRQHLHESVSRAPARTVRASAS